MWYYEGIKRGRVACTWESLGRFAQDREQDCGRYGGAERVEQEHDADDAAEDDGEEIDLLWRQRESKVIYAVGRQGGSGEEGNGKFPEPGL